MEAGIQVVRALRRPAIDALRKSKRFDPPVPIEKIAEMTKPYLSLGNQYGEGWFLAGEMIEKAVRESAALGISGKEGAEYEKYLWMLCKKTKESGEKKGK